MLTVAPDVYHAGSAEGTAILDARTGRWLMLDTDASRIWQALTVRGGTEGLAEEIAIPAGLDPAAVHQQIRGFLDDLTARGLLTDPAAGPDRSRWGRGRAR
ncbi:hypothetical protein GCM10027160_28710 [Streptomyces calidiresistens]|uniref:PqqD family protein n=1 Tax=Streptomyces calidiresistens TaxID=1485586 RepID=A0A7W3T1Q4_9ACTN|nr:PqqD family protein [Streptomyces calidiresistens]MBB0229300.1 hypothetical protein [Streptomyces calidiresistens]